MLSLYCWCLLIGVCRVHVRAARAAAGRTRASLGVGKKNVTSTSPRSKIIGAHASIHRASRQRLSNLFVTPSFSVFLTGRRRYRPRHDSSAALDMDPVEKGWMRRVIPKELAASVSTSEEQHHSMDGDEDTALEYMQSLLSGAGAYVTVRALLHELANTE